MEAHAIEDAPGPSGQSGPPSGEAPAGLREFFREWHPDAEDSGDEAGTSGTGSRRDTSQIEELDDIINNKARQIIWRTKPTGLDGLSEGRQGRRRVVTVTTVPGVTKPRMVEILRGITKPGRRYHVYVGNATVWKKLCDLRREGRIGVPYELIRCAHLVTTVGEVERQQELVREYHIGKTNHRGAAETLAALRRRYYWSGMRATIDRVLAACSVCARVKADTRPPREIQEVTPTATGPLKHVEVDIMTWKGRHWVTLEDKFSKFMAAIRVARCTGEAVAEAVRQWSGLYGVPEAITSDCGPEMRNAAVAEEARRLGIAWHFNTPGHPQGRGCVERLHGTLNDHLRICHAERGLEPEDAMVRAVIAYNHSIHTATGHSPVEVLFGGGYGRRDPAGTALEGPEADAIVTHVVTQRKLWATVRDPLSVVTGRRVLRHNVLTRDVTGRLAIGTIVYRRLATNRRKELVRYDGPHRVVAILERNRFIIEDCSPGGRRRTVHLRQLKLPAQSG